MPAHRPLQPARACRAVAVCPRDEVPAGVPCAPRDWRHRRVGHVATAVSGRRAARLRVHRDRPGDSALAACDCPTVRRGRARPPVEPGQVVCPPCLVRRSRRPWRGRADPVAAPVRPLCYRGTSPARASFCVARPAPTPVSSAYARFWCPARRHHHRAAAGRRLDVRPPARGCAHRGASCCANRDVLCRLWVIDRVVVSACAMGPMTDWLAGRSAKASGLR